MEKQSFGTTIRSLNYNVKLVFLYSVLQSFGRGIWMGNVLSMFILILANNSYTTLGWTSFATGIVLTIFVFPAGLFADKYGRDKLLKIASVIGLASIIIIIVGNSIVFIFISLSLWGLFQALNRPSLESIFADSVESGRRSKIYSWLHLTRNFAMAAGPFVNIPLFIMFGDSWELSILKSVMFVGIVLSLVSIIIMLFFKDKRSLGTTSESIEEEITEIVEEKNTNGYASKLSQDQKRKLIPYLLVGSNVIVGVGAGMTIKYFPGFFAEIYHLSPIWVQLIMGTTSVMTGVLSMVAQKFSLKRGRAVIIFVVQLTATLCLFGLVFYPRLSIMIPLFIVRGSLMNAAQPLSRSILMDVVPKKNRGKWNSLETLAWGFFWNFSAAIGGYLIGDEDPNFRLNFIVTASVYVIGIIPILFLIPLVSKERSAKKVLS
ncbi:MAG: MFS transporter [Candidatus Heimdallarchaeota archaeon]|nr:MFS transporter [Candidatus Heimdallarchaeota archaeon]